MNPAAPAKMRTEMMNAPRDPLGLAMTEGIAGLINQI